MLESAVHKGDAKNGVVINTYAVMAAAEGIVMHHDANLLAKNDGPIVTSKHWARALLSRMCFVKQQSNTKAKVGVPEFEQLKSRLAYDVKAIIEFGELGPHCCELYTSQFMDYAARG